MKFFLYLEYLTTHSWRLFTASQFSPRKCYKLQAFINLISSKSIILVFPILMDKLKDFVVVIIVEIT